MGGGKRGRGEETYFICDQLVTFKSQPFKKTSSDSQNIEANRQLNRAWDSLSLGDKRVLLDIADSVRNSKLTKFLPVKSPIRTELFALLTRYMTRATDQELVDFFGLSRTMVYRVRHVDFSRSFLKRLKYPLGVRRIRTLPAKIAEAIRLINILVPIRSGKGYRLLTWDFKELFRRYKEQAVS